MKYLAFLLCLLSTLLQAREITACGHPEYPPVSWLEQGAVLQGTDLQRSSLQGIAPSVAKHLFAQLGYRLKIDISGNWERCLQEVKAGNIDLVIAAYKTNTRRDFLDYSSEYMVVDPLSIFVNQQDKADYQSTADLQGKRVGLLLGDSFGDQFDLFLKNSASREFVSKGKQNLTKLAHQRIDFMPLGIISGQLQIEKFGFQDQIKLTPLTIGTEHFYLALGKHSELQQPLPFLNQSIKALKENGQIKALQSCFNQRYLSEINEVNCNVQP